MSVIWRLPAEKCFRASASVMVGGNPLMNILDDAIFVRGPHKRSVVQCMVAGQQFPAAFYVWRGVEESAKEKKSSLSVWGGR